MITQLLYDETYDCTTRKLKEKGFYHNIDIVHSGFKSKNMWTIIVHDEFVGFCVTDHTKYNPLILWIRSDERKNGYGKFAVEFFEKRAFRKGLRDISVRAIDESVGFWVKMCYNNVGDMLFQKQVGGI